MLVDCALAKAFRQYGLRVVKERRTPSGKHFGSQMQGGMGSKNGRQIPMATTERLKLETETYEREKSALIAAGGEGKFVLIHGSTVVGTWGTYEDALREGYQKFRLEPFLVKQVQGHERVQFISRDFPLRQT